jgi:hypothetical protein
MVLNPYRKNHSSQMTTKKRTERPWESDDNSKTNPAIPITASVTVATVSSNEDPFDCGIDWDEAERVLDAATSSSLQPPTSTATSLVSSTVATQKQPQRVAVTAPTGGCSSEDSQEAQKNGGTGGLLSSLRPEEWKKPVAIKGPAVTSSNILSSTNRYNDPRQESLPPPLQFDPETVKPVQDQYRTQLVNNADLTVPLLNGWKLYAHQKRAILCGILMRRMILALDMVSLAHAVHFMQCFSKCPLNRCCFLVLLGLGEDAHWLRLGKGLLPHNAGNQGAGYLSGLSPTRMETNG